MLQLLNSQFFYNDNSCLQSAAQIFKIYFKAL